MNYLTKNSLTVSFLSSLAKRWFWVVFLTLGMLHVVLAAMVNTPELVSVNKDGTDSGSGPSSGPSISADGRFIVFSSVSDDLVAQDSNGQSDVFVRDLQTKITSLVSINRDGTDSGNAQSFSPVISANGRFVGFYSPADDLVATDTNGDWDVFARDLQNGTTTLISVNKEGSDSANGDSFGTAFSADGRFVAFCSGATNLTAMNDFNGKVDVFVRDLQNRTTTLVSVNKDGTGPGSDESFNPVISANGRFVSFDSPTDDLVTTDTNGAWDVFARDLQSGITTLVSVNRDGTDSGNWYSSYSSISADGRFVAFESGADDLVAMDTNGESDVFVRDLTNGTTTLISINKDGTDSGNGYSAPSTISADGRFVVFSSDSDDLVAVDNNGYQDGFIRDLQTGTTTLISLNKDGTDSGNGPSVPVRISADGRYVTFVSYANDLVATDTNGEQDMFVRDLKNGTTTLISVNKDGTDSGSGLSFSNAVSDDGRFVAFESHADDLVATDTNGWVDVFVFDMQKAPQGCNCDAPEAIKGTSGPDFLYGTEQADIICGFGDHDFIAGLGGDDCIDGGDGNDWIDAGRGNDMIYGRSGTDVIYGDRGNDEISGDDGEDFLFGGDGNDRLDGGEGYDWLFCGHGVDEGIGEYVRSCEH